MQCPQWLSQDRPPTIRWRSIAEPCSAAGCRCPCTAPRRSPRIRRPPSERPPSPPSTSLAASPATAATTRCWLAAAADSAGGTVFSAASGRCFAKHVTHSSHGVDQSWLAICFGLASQVSDVDFQRVAGSRKVEAPHLLENPAAGQYPSRIGDQHLQQSEFGAGEADLTLPASHFSGYRIQGEIPERHGHGFA